MNQQDLEASLMLLGWTRSVLQQDIWWLNKETRQRICIYPSPIAFKVGNRQMCRGSHDFNGKAITYHSHFGTLLKMATGDKYEAPDNSQSVSRDDLAGRNADVTSTDGLEI